jgi:hypothetical protein
VVKYRFGPGGADRLPGLRHRRKNRGMKTGLLALVLLAMCCGAGIAAAADDLASAIAAVEKREGADSPYLLPLLEPLAQQRFRDGKLAEAGELRRRALKIALGAFGSGSASAAEAMTALALSNIDARRYLDAEPLLIAAAEVLKERVDGDHPALANVFAGLARVALARGDADAALAWAEKAAAIAAKNPHQRATEPMLALAAALAAKERLTEAERTAREALARDRETHGPESSAAARSLSQLANVYIRDKRYREALPLLEEAASLDQARLGPGHPFIGDDLYDVGVVLDGLKRPEAARKAFSAAVRVFEAGEAKETPRAAYAERELARMLRGLGKSEEADEAAKDSRRILKRAETEERDRERQI